MFGNSVVAGIGLEECDSSPSALQALLNQTEKAVKVLNLGVDGQNFSQLAYRITDSYIEPNSVIVVVMCIRAEFQFLLKNLFEKNHIPYCATIEYFQRPHQLGEVFFNAHHLTIMETRKLLK